MGDIRQKLLSADVRRVKIDVDGTEVFVRGLFGAEYDRWYAETEKNNNESSIGLALVVEMCTVDVAGKQVFEPGDAAQIIKAMPMGAILKISQTAFELSGLGEVSRSYGDIGADFTSGSSGNRSGNSGSGLHSGSAKQSRS